MIHFKYAVGDAVQKPKGYPFPGLVVAAFMTLHNEVRYVVESTTLRGLLHIFNEDQLTLREAHDKEACDVG